MNPTTTTATASPRRVKGVKPIRPKWAVPTAESDPIRVRMKPGKHLKTPMTLNIEKAIWESQGRGQGRYQWVGDTCEMIRFVGSDEGLFTEPCFVLQPHTHLEHVRAAAEEAAHPHEGFSSQHFLQHPAGLNNSQHTAGIAACLYFLPAAPTTHARPLELHSEEQIAKMSYEDLLKFAGGFEKDILDELDLT